MNINITLKKEYDAENSATAILINSSSNLSPYFSGPELDYINNYFKEDNNCLDLNNE